VVQGERQPAHCVLAHHVRRNQGVLDHTEKRRHVDQHSVALRPELLQRCARRQGGSQHVGAHEPLDRVDRLVLHSAGDDHRGAVHPRVDPSERLIGAASDVLEVAGTRDVPRHGNGSGAESAAFLDQRGQIVLVSCRQDELRVVLGERERRCSTNAAARPDDHDHRTRQFPPHSRAALTPEESLRPSGRNQWPSTPSASLRAGRSSPCSWLPCGRCGQWWSRLVLRWWPSASSTCGRRWPYLWPRLSRHVPCWCRCALQHVRCARRRSWPTTPSPGPCVPLDRWLAWPCASRRWRPLSHPRYRIAPVWRCCVPPSTLFGALAASFVVARGR